MSLVRRTAVCLLLLMAVAAHATPGQARVAEEEPSHPASANAECPAIDPQPPDPFHPIRRRAVWYESFAREHKLTGLASYYSSSLDGNRTANGEIFRNSRLSAAHLTLPLGTWIEVESRQTRRRIRCRVNDRGPYAKKFMLDLSQAAARALGVDVARDRHVSVRVIAFPGEEPLPEEWEEVLAPGGEEETSGVETPIVGSCEIDPD